jgi:hypothetical protein
MRVSAPWALSERASYRFWGKVAVRVRLIITLKSFIYKTLHAGKGRGIPA